MKRLLYISMLILLGLSSCKRRPLNEEVSTLAMVPVAIDWSKSNLKVDDITRVTVRVFPHDGSQAYNFVMQESKTNDIIPLAIGKYSFVIFNETIDASDWNSLVFRNIDNYDSFAVASQDETFKGLYTKIDEDIIRKSPDELAVFSIDEFEVTQEMVNYTRSLFNGENTKSLFPSATINKVEQDMSLLTKITPISVIKHITVMARVENLVSAKKSSGAIRGAVGALKMSTRKPIEARITHIFIMNGRQYDNPEIPKNGTIGAMIAIFDPINAENLKSDLMLDFQLHDDTTPPTEVFDITSDLQIAKSEINIFVGNLISGRKGDRPIVLPAFSLTGNSIGVDDWSDVIVPLK